MASGQPCLYQLGGDHPIGAPGLFLPVISGGNLLSVFAALLPDRHTATVALMDLGPGHEDENRTLSLKGDSLEAVRNNRR